MEFYASTIIQSFISCRLNSLICLSRCLPEDLDIPLWETCILICLLYHITWYRCIPCFLPKDLCILLWEICTLICILLWIAAHLLRDQLLGLVLFMKCRCLLPRCIEMYHRSSPGVGSPIWELEIIPRFVF